MVQLHELQCSAYKRHRWEKVISVIFVITLRKGVNTTSLFFEVITVIKSYYFIMISCKSINSNVVETTLDFCNYKGVYGNMII